MRTGITLINSFDVYVFFFFEKCVFKTTLFQVFVTLLSYFIFIYLRISCCFNISMVLKNVTQFQVHGINDFLVDFYRLLYLYASK